MVVNVLIARVRDEETGCVPNRCPGDPPEVINAVRARKRNIFRQISQGFKVPHPVFFAPNERSSHI